MLTSKLARVTRCRLTAAARRYDVREEIYEERLNLVVAIQKQEDRKKNCDMRGLAEEAEEKKCEDKRRKRREEVKRKKHLKTLCKGQRSYVKRTRLR